jgi:hypothetical protein
MSLRSSGLHDGIHPSLNFTANDRAAMDPTSLIAAFIGAQTGMVQLAVAARLARMNSGQGAAVAQLVDAAQQSIDPLANVAAGIGTNLNVSA